MKQFRVLIIDIQSHDTLPEMPGLFVNAGCVVDVLCTKQSWLRRNRFVNKWILVDSNLDNQAQQVIDLSGNYDWVVLGDDATIRLMNRAIPNNDPIARKILPLSNLVNREMLGSKIGFIRICQRCNIQIPRSIICTRETCVDSAKKIGYPIVIKSDHGHSGTGVVKCDNVDSLRTATMVFGEHEVFLIQQYIDGNIINTESLFRNGELLVYAYSKTIENISHEFGVSSVRGYYACSIIEPVLNQIGSSIGLNGFVNMTFMRDYITGNHFLIEADPRPQAWVPMAKFAGVDFAVAVRNYLHQADQSSPLTPLPTGEGNRTIRPTDGTPKNPIIIRHFTRDLMRCIIKRDWYGILAWVVNRDNRWKFVPWGDPVLVFWMMGRVIKFWWKL